MRYLFLLIFLALFPLILPAQYQEDRAEIANLIDRLFDGMRASDTASMSPLFLPGARLQSVFYDAEGNTVIREGSIQGWLNGVGSPKEHAFDERIWSKSIEVDPPLATAWTEYTFFLGEELHHCGFNAFQLVKKDGKWRIYQVTDTRRKTDCKSSDD